MPIIIDPETRQRVLVDKHVGDVKYMANLKTAGTAVGQEDIPVIGNWSDFTGSGKVSSREKQMFAGAENELQGTEAQVESNAKLPNLTERGNRLNTHRTRIRQILRETKC